MPTRPFTPISANPMPSPVASPINGRILGLSPYGKPKTGELDPSLYGKVLGQDTNITDRIRNAIGGVNPNYGDRDVVGLVNKVVNEGYPIEEVLKMVGGGGGSPAPVQTAQSNLSPYGRPKTGEVDPSRYGTILGQNPQVTAAVRNAAINRYGSDANQRQVVGLVNKVVNEGYPLEEVIRLLKQDYEEKDPDKVAAAQQVAIKYDPVQNQLERSQRDIAEELQRAISAQNLYGDKADERIGAVYNELAKTLGNNVSKTASIYDAAKGQVGQGYDDASKAAAGASDTARSSLMADMQRLGLGAAAPDVLGKLASQTAQFTSQNAASKAGAQGGLESLGAAISALAQQGVSDSAREGAQARTDLASQVAGNIGNLQLGAAKDTRSILDQLTDVAGQRGQDISTTLREIIQGRQDREAQAKQDALAEEIQRRTLGIQEQELGLKAQGQSFDQDLATQQLELDRAKLTAAQATDPFEQQLAQLKVKQAEANLALTQAKLNGSPNAAKQKGYGAYIDFISKPSNYWGATGAGPKFTSAIEAILQDAGANSMDPNNLVASQQNAYNQAMNLVSAPEYSSLNRDALRRALGIIFQKST